MVSENTEISKGSGLLTGAGIPPVLDIGLIQSIFHTSPDFLVRLDSEGLVTYINQVFVEHGDPENVLGTPILEFLTAPSKALMRAAMSQARTEGENERIEVQMLQGVWLQVRLFPVWQKERFDGYVLISSDVSRLKDDQKRLF